MGVGSGGLVKTTRSTVEWAAGWAGAVEAADFSVRVVCREKSAIRVEEVTEKAKAGRRAKPEDWFVGAGMWGV